MKKDFLRAILFSTFLTFIFISCEKDDDEPSNNNSNNNTPQETIYVSKDVQMKNAIIEEFTGVRCPNCPAGHQVAAEILSAYPDDAFVIGLHPTNSSYTQPISSGDPDLRKSFLDDWYDKNFLGGRFMPGATINRKTWDDNKKIQSRSLWKEYAEDVITENSPVNVGFKSTYDKTSKELKVEVHIYYTSDVTDPNFLYVMLAENDLVVPQSNGGTDYVHKHVFRESLTTGTWGEEITEETTEGSLIKKTYTFSNADENYLMDNCELLVYIRNGSNEEIITGIGTKVGKTITK